MTTAQKISTLTDAQIEKTTMKKVLGWMVELYCEGCHKEVSRLYQAWAKTDDYDTRAATYRSGKMFNAGVRWKGFYEVYFVAA